MVYHSHGIGMSEKDEKIKELEELMKFLSHDLRNPLQAIDSAVFILNGECKKIMTSEDYKKVQKWIDAINNHINRSKIIIRDVKDYIETGESVYKFSKYSMYKLVETLLQDYSHRFEEASIDIENNLQEELEVRCDKNKMERVWINYLTNAIKYSKEDEPDKWVEIGCTVKEDEYEFYVKDNGIGIAGDDLSKIGTPYQRFHEKREDGSVISGTGLGLAGVNKIITNHGGRTWVESELGKGSTFYFTLPIKNQ